MAIFNNILGLIARKPDFVHANNKDADQQAHPRSLFSAFVIRLLESLISKLTLYNI